jgi:hypothetical protein
MEDWTVFDVNAFDTYSRHRALEGYKFGPYFKTHRISVANSKPPNGIDENDTV